MRSTAGLRAVLAAVLPLAIYVCFALLFFGRRVDWTAWCFVKGPDPAAIIWFINWWPFAISHHLNPFFSDYTWFPDRDYLPWRTSVPAVAMAGLPLTLLGGPVFTYNCFTVFAPAASAWCAFFLARYLTGDWAASVIGGYIFGFSSYEFGQMLGHLNLDLTFLVPLIVLLCVQYARGSVRRRRFIGLLAGLLLCQFGISMEILASLGLFIAIGWAICLAYATAAERAGMFRLGADAAIAAALALVIASPLLVYLIIGRLEVPAAINTPIGFSTDPLNYIVPTAVTWLGGTAMAPLASQFTGYLSEQGGYLGLPLVALMVAYFRAQAALPHMRAVLVFTVVLGLFSLGPYLHLGVYQSRFVLPWSLFWRWPILDEMLPGRFTMYISLISGIVTALFLAVPGPLKARAARFMLAGVIGVFLLPNTDLYRWYSWPKQEFFTSPNLQRDLGANPVVLVLPFGSTGNAIAWQVDAGMRFKQAGVYDGFTPEFDQQYSILNELLMGSPGPRFRQNLADFCFAHHIGYILMGPGTPPMLQAAIAAKHWPMRMDLGIGIVQVP